MSEICLEDLKAKAIAATPGPWKLDDCGILETTEGYNILGCFDFGPPTTRDLTNEAFIAAANPSAVLELIERLQQAEAERHALNAELEKAKAMASKAQELAEWHLTHRTFAESQNEVARKQEPFVYCFTDVNGKPTQFTDAPKYSHPNDLRVITPPYASPVPAQQPEISWDIQDFTEEQLLRLTKLLQPRELIRVPAQQLPDDARYPFDPIYDKGEYYITGAAINEILIPFVDPQTAQQLALEEGGDVEVKGNRVACYSLSSSSLPQGRHTLYIKKQ